MHSAVLQNKDYIKFAEKSTVEVISLSALDQGVAKSDKKAAKYTATVDGQEVELMVEFPNLTYDEMIALNRSKASTYNDTGKIPFTCLVDPHTLEEIYRFPSASGGTIMKKVKEVTKDLKREHGPGISRKEIESLDDAITEASAQTKEGEFAAAVSALEKVAKNAEDWPQELQARLTKARETVLTEAEKRIAEIEATAGEDPEAATRELAKLRSKLRGTGLEDRVKEIADGIAGS